VNTRSQYKSPAIILRCRDYGDTDRIVVLYTRDHGKLSSIAKGAKKSRKRFANALEPFTCAQFIFSRRGRDTLALLENCDPINHYEAIRGDLDKTLLASYLVDLIEQFTVDGKKNDDLYELLVVFLTLIAEGNTSESLTRFFEMRLLKLLGYEPLLDSCTVCKTPVANGTSYHFSPREGGIRCVACSISDPEGVAVSTGALKSLLLGRDIDTSIIGRISLTPQTTVETRRMLGLFIRHLLGRELRSLQVLHQIRRLGI
jgi:DNA repair protein RecO (recombination protein O)